MRIKVSEKLEVGDRVLCGLSDEGITEAKVVAIYPPPTDSSLPEEIVVEFTATKRLWNYPHLVRKIEE